MKSIFCICVIIIFCTTCVISPVNFVMDINVINRGSPNVSVYDETIYSTATMQDEFTPDRVLVTLTRQELPSDPQWE